MTIRHLHYIHFQKDLILLLRYIYHDMATGVNIV